MGLPDWPDKEEGALTIAAFKAKQIAKQEVIGAAEGKTETKGTEEGKENGNTENEKDRDEGTTTKQGEQPDPSADEET